MIFPFWRNLNIPRTWEDCLTTLQQMNFLAKWLGETEEEVENNTDDIEALESVTATHTNQINTLNEAIAGIVSPTEAQLVPTNSGTEGQVLTRVTGGNIREWKNVPKELPQNGTVGQVLKKTATGTEWADESGGGGSSLPSGGTTGQILAKNSDVSGDAGWINNMPQISDEDSFINILNDYITEVHDYIDNSDVLYRNFQWDDENKNLTFEIYNESDSNTIDTGYVDGLRIGWLNAYRIHDEIEQEYEPIVITVTGGLTNTEVYSIRNRYDWYWSFVVEGNIIGTVAPLSYVTVTVHIEGLQSITLPMLNLIIKPSLPYDDGTEGVVYTYNGKDYHIRNIRTVPSGGNQGDVLVKDDSLYDGSYSWQAPSSGGDATYPITKWAGTQYREPVGLYQIDTAFPYHQVVIDGINGVQDPETGKMTYTFTLLNNGEAISSPVFENYCLKLQGSNNDYVYTDVSSEIRSINTLIGEFLSMVVRIDDMPAGGLKQISFTANVIIPSPYMNDEYLVSYKMGNNTGIVPLYDNAQDKSVLFEKRYELRENHELVVQSVNVDNDNHTLSITIKNTDSYDYTSNFNIYLEYNGNLMSVSNISPSNEDITSPYEGIMKIEHSSLNPIQAGSSLTITANFQGYIDEVNYWYYVRLYSVDVS